MAFQQDVVQEAQQMREQGLSDGVIINEFAKKGFSPDEVSAALAQLENVSDRVPGSEQFSTNFPEAPTMQSTSMQSVTAGRSPQQDTSIYDRIEEITENLIDEKWDELIAEVKKIIEWKERVEEHQRALQNEVAKLKEDFKTLHAAVLGKLGDYDTRMQEVGTELQAVGKVFKEVIPEFVENVKELSHMTGKLKTKK